ncbi:MAG: hypothetical protein IH623_18930 [Verrucomicrobia bacterium]|nr:hypothetical protein [Verrucomicrobiota bacterium]
MNNIPRIKSFSKKASACALAVLLFSVATSFGQCDKNVVLTCAKTEYLNAEGVVQRTVEEECVIKVSKSEVTIAPSGHVKMTGSVTSTVCDWKQPFKVGKTTLEATFKNENGDTRNATLIIEGKDGKITCVMKEKARPDRVIRATANKFEEQK